MKYLLYSAILFLTKFFWGDSMTKYFNHRIKKAIVVDALVTIESLDISSAFTYPEEVHDFYEFVYIDSGTLICHREDKEIELSQGDLYLIRTGKSHFYSAKEGCSAEVFIVCFRSASQALSILDKKVALSKESRAIIYEIVKESKNAFVFPFDRKLKLLDSPVFGAQQLVEAGIERLLIQLVREESETNKNIKFVMNTRELENNLVNDIVTVLKNSLYSRISLEEISRQTYYSKTFLNGIFKKNTDYSIMQYYGRLKIEEAKKLLREGISPSVVSGKLQFESPTYFTKVFKKYTGITPSEYKKKII